ncbi:protein FAM83F [Bufo bufo]|uniref:protein FAM83F n=1 Tax=Bufo bufo TaxID=8384 RepID=UPI001ABEA66E|nr:protein FAM83F [Bufo bufo]XP_040263835.1 protein FAM83F [Bufo bufo]
MAESQLLCLRDDHVNEKITENMVYFYYSEDQRRCLEVLVNNGIQAYRQYIKEKEIKDFLSTKELTDLKCDFKKYEIDSPKKPTKQQASKQQKEKESTLQYWPALSDTEIPPLDLGWPDKGYYRGVSQMLVYTHPPKENAPTIKAVVREMIQSAKKVIAIVMDYFTDREVFKDVLDAADKRRVPVYMILGESGVKHFLEMCEFMQVPGFKLRNLRVRYVTGVGFYLTPGKIGGCISHKYIMVDSDKVAFGSFRLTWSSLRVDRSIMTLLSGQYAEPFDIEFRELYAISEEVNLYKELGFPDVRPSPMVGARARSSTVARKLINPKYTLVVGRSPAPGEMLRFGTPNPPASKDNEESEGDKRMATFLEDLITIEQEFPENVNLDILPKVAILTNKQTAKAPEDNRTNKSTKKPSFRFFKKSQPNSQEKEVDGGFVLLTKPKLDLSQSNSFRSQQDLRASGNISPVSTKSEKPKQDKCIIS